jgi:hypothetical protein
MSGEMSAELGLVGGLQLVVELFAHATAQLVDQPLRVEALEHERSAESIEGLGIVEVGIDRLRYSGVLHLDRDISTVTGDGAMDLADTCCSDRHDLPIEKDPFRRLAELVRHHLRGEG